jgi:hypothetical protein
MDKELRELLDHFAKCLVELRDLEDHHADLLIHTHKVEEQIANAIPLQIEDPVVLKVEDDGIEIMYDILKRPQPRSGLTIFVQRTEHQLTQQELLIRKIQRSKSKKQPPK